ncbi:excalibur calcium-binding domain-containing protein [Cupriavidus basilensis]|nr:excalibur calcium-binding domain-containing protein [Cupriavidus basilensis]MDF3883094.1 excalibur calcium-binding domain-containing protein [Cupriavidus basilensis]
MQHCSQMTSCEEARFYLRSCPGVKIDGDGDGIPCEVPPLQCS